MSSEAFIALGSNLGDREAHLRFAVQGIDALPGVEFVRGSRIYETEPVGPAGQGAYLNAVVEVATTRTPRELLTALLGIEEEAGRKRSAEETRWGPRVLDLDLLLYGDRQIDEPGLSLPHPRMHERAFVLEPLCEIAGDRLHPRLRTRFAELAAQVGDPEAVRPTDDRPLDLP